MSGAARPPAFVNDLETCVGCHACAVACANENQLAPGTSWRHIVTFNETRRAGLPTFHLSLACNHCRDAPCLTYCPALAISREAATGAVLIDADHCIGCRYCSWVCPYDAPRFDDDAGVMRKCTLCAGRLAEGLAPACVSGCPVGALQIGAPADEEPLGIAGFPSTSIGPSIRFVPMRTRAASQVAITAGHEAPPMGAAASAPKISSRSEWALVAFTFIAQVLVGLVLAATLTSVDVPAWFLLAAGLLAMGLSTLHLGRPERAWRAMLNVRRSWLSREVVTWSAFLALTTVAIVVDGAGAATRWVAAVVGLGCLVCVDRVYVVMARVDRMRIDDVSALTAGLFLGAVFAGFVWLALALALWRLAAFRQRTTGWFTTMSVASWLAAARVGLTAVGLALLARGVPAGVPVGIAAVVVAELIDRIVFYDTLDLVTPRSQVARDLARAV